MKIFFSGIGGAAIGPLALIAKDAGYEVCGSDQQESGYIKYLRSRGVKDIKIGQTAENLQGKNIDWLVHSSAVTRDNPEIAYAKSQSIKVTKRDALINDLLKEKNLKMVAIAGTHGKTTTTAMVVWLFKQLKIPVSYSVGAKISFGQMGEYNKSSEYFVYEADEFDRNFLSFHPHLSIVAAVTYDHHEIYKTRDEYKQAFKQFIDQSDQVILWQTEYDYLKLKPDKTYIMLSPYGMPQIELAGKFNRQDAWLAVHAVHRLTKEPADKLLGIIKDFPGLQRRMEQIKPNLYSDYAHTPEEIRACLSVATEIAQRQKIIVVYEPLTNRRQHYMKDNYRDCFTGADKVYWLPSYLAREDPDQPVLNPADIIQYLSDPEIAEPKQRDGELKQTIKKHLDNGDIVVCIAGGGGNSLDEWLRKEVKKI